MRAIPAGAPTWRDMVRALPDAIRGIAKQARKEGLDHPAMTRMVGTLSERAERCAQLLAI